MSRGPAGIRSPHQGQDILNVVDAFSPLESIGDEVWIGEETLDIFHLLIEILRGTALESQWAYGLDSAPYRFVE